MVDEDSGVTYVPLIVTVCVLWL